MKYVVLIITMCLALNSCATVKKIGRTTNDIASALCNIFAEENVDELQGFSPEDWCEVHDHLEPFIEYVLTAKHAAGAAALSVDTGAE